MKNIWVAISLYIVAHLSLVFFSLPSQSLLPATNALIALNSMALSLILAARFSLIDYLIGGPDKVYVAHRWLGYIAVMSLSLHWVSAKSAGVAVIPALSHLGEEAGEFAAILILSLVAVSILKIIPYHLWKQSHLLMGPLFAIAAFHSFFSSSPFIVYSVTWFMMLCLSSLAIIAWFKTLYNRRKKTVVAKVISIKKTADVIDIQLQTSHSIKSKPGQFATISVNKKGLNEQHPFTIAGVSSDGSMRFIIANAGDYTRKLIHELRIDDEVHIHNIAGRFNPEYKRNRNAQVWIAAGSGVTPFLATLNQMQSDEGEKIDFIYACGKNTDPSICEQLQTYQDNLTQFNLHLLSPKQRLNACHFEQLHLKQVKTDLYLCGPDRLKQAARQLWIKETQQKTAHVGNRFFKLFAKTKLLKGKIYSEAFDFRAAIKTKTIAKLMLLLSKALLNKKTNEVFKKTLINIKMNLTKDQPVYTGNKLVTILENYFETKKQALNPIFTRLYLPVLLVSTLKKGRRLLNTKT